MKRAYCNLNLRGKTLTIIETANSIIEEYEAEGYDLTLRQLYYQFVARDIIPNSQREYKKLGTAINNGRLAGLIDWDSIVDRTRKFLLNNHWDTPDEIIEDAASWYARDTRESQDTYIEVWVEKDALVGVIEQACDPLDVGYLSCRGFVSQSAMYRAALRFKRKEQRQETILLHLGDHDPSGIDMTRDIQDRLKMFGSDVGVKRIALNMGQVEEYNPPPNYAKSTDSRYADYASKYGDDSWELDALDPRVITELIIEKVSDYTDGEKRNAIIEEQEKERLQIKNIANNWND